MILNLVSTLLAINTFGATNRENFDYYNEQSSISNESKMAAISIGLENPLDDQYVVRDLSGNVFVIQENIDEGFMVYDPLSKKSIEGVMSTTCPFVFDDSRENYYFGPMNYYYRIGESFVHYIDDKYNIDLGEAYRLQKSFDTFLENLRKEPSHQFSQKLSKGNNVSLPNDFYTYIDNYQYVKDCSYPENHDNSCGFVAGSVVLHYWDKTVHDGVVDAAFKDSVTGELNSTNQYSPSTNLKDKLVSYCASTQSTGRIVSEAINNYCEDYGIQGSASWSLFGLGLVDSLRNNRPVAIFGYLPHVQNGGMLMHAVVLSKDRNNQTVINLSFPKKTRELRIYAHFNDMPPPVDRNKGRISIGNITIDSYN